MEKEAFMEKLLSFMKEEAYKPLTVQELEEMLNITEAEEFKEPRQSVSRLGRKRAYRTDEKRPLRHSGEDEFNKRKDFSPCERIRLFAA